MTTTTTTTTTTPVAAPPRREGELEVGPVTQAKVIRSEWIKLRSIRSTPIVSALTVVVMVALGVLLPYFGWRSASAAERAGGFDALGRSLAGVHLAVLTVGVLGVLVITGEYTSGMIRATLGAVPRRLPVLWAKMAVFAPLTFVVSLGAALVAFTAGQALIAPHGVSLGSPGALRAVFGVALFLTVMGLLGLALGFLTRSTAGGIAAVVGFTFVLQAIGAALPTSWQRSALPYFPLQAGEAIFTVHRDEPMMHPWPGFALFCGYTALAIAAAAYTLRHRDA